MADLLQPDDLFGYQKEGIYFGLYRPDAMYWLGLGLGKTVIALTVGVDRMRAGQVNKILVLGPLRVVQSVWHTEARKWEHLKHLRFSLVHGSANERRRALFANADVTLVNYDNLNWLAEELDHYFLSRGHPLPWEMCIYDEVTKVKNSTSVRINGGKREVTDPRTKRVTTVVRTGWRKFLDSFEYRMGLTGSPASNGYEDLHGQFLAVDGGRRLGPRKTPYMENYFSKQWDGHTQVVTEVGRQMIEKRIADITLNMDTRDYRGDMPEAVEKNVCVDLPPKAKKSYRDMERTMFAELQDGRNVEVFNGAAAATKCLQIANGSAYVDEPPEDEADGYELEGREWSKVHDAKIKALEEIIDDANGKQVLVAYSFKTDAERIMHKFKKLNPVNLTAEPAGRTEKRIQEWKDGKIRLMVGHPASMGHGIDGLQEAGNIIVWFGVPHSLELYDQMNARLDRPGQKSSVSIIRILANETIDMAVAEALKSKSTDEQTLKNAIQAYKSGGEVTFM